MLEGRKENRNGERSEEKRAVEKKGRVGRKVVGERGRKIKRGQNGAVL